jgi:hypothetical protein
VPGMGTFFVHALRWSPPEAVVDAAAPMGALTDDLRTSIQTRENEAIRLAGLTQLTVCSPAQHRETAKAVGRAVALIDDPEESVRSWAEARGRPRSGFGPDEGIGGDACGEHGSLPSGPVGAHHYRSATAAPRAYQCFRGRPSVQNAGSRRAGRS